jgi:hypothetical protein
MKLELALATNSARLKSVVPRKEQKECGKAVTATPADLTLLVVDQFEK